MLKELFNINKKSLINWILLKIKFLTKKKKKKKKKKRFKYFINWSLPWTVDFNYTNFKYIYSYPKHIIPNISG